MGTQRKGGIFLGILGIFWNLVFSKNRNQGLGGGSELNVDSHKRLNSVRGSKVDIGVGVSDPCFFFVILLLHGHGTRSRPTEAQATACVYTKRANV